MDKLKDKVMMVDSEWLSTHWDYLYKLVDKLSLITSTHNDDGDVPKVPLSKKEGKILNRLARDFYGRHGSLWFDEFLIKGSKKRIREFLEEEPRYKPLLDWIDLVLDTWKEEPLEALVSTQLKSNRYYVELFNRTPRVGSSMSIRVGSSIGDVRRKLISDGGVIKRVVRIATQEDIDTVREMGGLIEEVNDRY